jgi:hypothetical protein
MSYPILSARSSLESLQSDSSSISSPDKLAPAVVGSLVWQGDELSPAKYVIKLGDRDILDIRAAIIKFKLKYTPASLSMTETNPHTSHWASTDKDKREDL